MHNIDEISAEDELIRLLLKRQTELNALLEVTQAINKDTATPTLIQMLQVILKSYLQVGKLRFLIERDGSYILISKYGGDIEPVGTLHTACFKLKKFKWPTPISNHDDEVLRKYDYFIPIYHKKKALAFALIGDFNPSSELLNNDLNFIQTVINVIVVALENKRLFKERLLSERFQREMELAVEVQNMLIPIKAYKDTSVEVSARYIPHQNIGGDYFDFIRLNEHEFLWCIADVSGKGISAALLMANFQASLRAWSVVEDDLTTIVDRLNKVVINNTKGERFITLFLAKYNEKTRKLTYINAGHNATVLFSQNEAITLKLGSTMIGVFDDLPFINQGEVDIEPGTMIVNYTDGLMDHQQSNKNWKEENLIEFIKAHGHQTPNDFNELLMDHINRVIKGKPIDDVTLLSLRIF
ncbi:PP2C family protein-serine/threonine phosphatase [Mucilaginibacter xinganensis]|uniref:Serine/threonine protein phosphatase n=1 Tax=Mucilaginibacter xinganensis TaxID=1234841 RepID=A0A223NUV7_9SPHI|nr:PP2C family protein-serine/threonine phosphatase [Mucilaginibacter xinganensis]ASU33454.1 serine/threonine protein phosphatase [Mucilaginibacter xinganensis]